MKSSLCCQAFVMNPVRSILEVRFSAPARQFNFIAEIVRGLGAPEPKEKRQLIFSPADIRVNIENRKMSIHFGPTRYAVNIEENLPSDEIRKIIVDMSNRLMSNLQWTTMSRIGLRTIWLNKTDDFKNLVQRSKGAFFLENSLIQRAVDVGVPLTFLDRDATISYMYGPMERTQLVRLNFEFPIDAPDQFMYVDTDYHREPNQTFSIKYLKDFLRAGIVRGADLANETLTMLGV